MKSLLAIDGITDSTLRVGSRVWFRSGLYGDGRDRTIWGRIIAGPRRNPNSDMDSWQVVGERYPGCSSSSALFTDGVWMGRVHPSTLPPPAPRDTDEDEGDDS
ncbi:hypothetical protein EV383_4461 [Pseudonocardia sediminis]|uniref:Uncharacterized protein n=1 Tax=Pseudonocardia sediminis TaxID=1397368 RepID=A0A4Q7UZV2_PSEST|nr:hypothetical protein EV383_4461 [Pseudonocardia sediminis]